MNKARYRRGTKNNPFVKGERVRFKVGGDMGKVLKRDCSEQNWNEPRGYAPIEYLVQRENGTTEWSTARQLESVDERYAQQGAA